MAKQKEDLNALFTRLIKQDPWRMRVIGREASIDFMRKKKKLATSTEEKAAWDDIIELEKQVKTAAENKDQAAWDHLNSIKTPYENMKRLKEAA